MNQDIKAGTPSEEAGTKGEEGGTPSEASGEPSALSVPEYPIRALVRAGLRLARRWPQPGTIIMAKKDECGGGYTSPDPGRLPFEWFGSDLIIDPTPEQIAAERAEAGLPPSPAFVPGLPSSEGVGTSQVTPDPLLVEMVEVIEKAQAVLARHLEPEPVTPGMVTIRDLLEILDDRKLVEAIRAFRAKAGA